MACGIFKGSAVPLIESDPAVFKAEIILADTYISGRDDYIGISFIDGNNIKVSKVNEFGKGKGMYINTVNDYFVCWRNINTNMSVDSHQKMKILSSLLGVQLKTVMDIVKNYRAICSLEENAIDMSDYKKDNENIYETMRRVCSEGLYPASSIVTFNGQEYIVYKWHPKIL
jgi:hypothetical protein